MLPQEIKRNFAYSSSQLTTLKIQSSAAKDDAVLQENPDRSTKQNQRQLFQVFIYKFQQSFRKFNLLFHSPATELYELNEQILQTEDSNAVKLVSDGSVFYSVSDTRRKFIDRNGEIQKEADVNKRAKFRNQK